MIGRLTALFVTMAVIAAGAFAIWFLLFSGRVRTATPTARRKLWHVMFMLFFIGYSAALAAWMVSGIVAAVAHHNDAFHERLHAYGGAPDTVLVEATDAQPFRIDGSRRIREMTIRSGGTAKIALRVSADVDGEYIVFTHNISVRDGTTTIFRGEEVAPIRGGEADEFNPLGLQDGFALYEFPAPPPGLYSYQCDLHPEYQRGTVRVVPASATSTEVIEPGTRDMARRIAEVSHLGQDLWKTIADYLFSAVSFGLGIFLVVLRPHERAARIFGVAMVGTAAAYNLQGHAALAVHSAFDDPLHTLLHPLTGIAYIYALVTFPDGRLVPRWSKRLVRIGYRFAFFFGAMILLGVTGSALPDFATHPAALVVTFGMVIPLIGIAAQTYRLRKATTSETRQQSRLLVWALIASAAFGLVLLVALRINIPALLQPNRVDPTLITSTEGLAFRVFQPLFVVIPIALFAGILRYRLWDVDLVINKALVYGTLAGIIGALYVGIVVGLGGAVGGRLGLSLAATVIVGLAFDPLRERLQRIANRLVFGERATAYQVMTDASHRLAGATSADEMLAAVAEAAGRAVGAARARARLHQPVGETRAASWPPGDDTDIAFDRTIDVVHQGRLLGQISVAKKPGDTLRPGENRLLSALASQVAPALQNIRLAEELRARLAELQSTARELGASRSRLARAADAERRRLEQEIHHGVEHQLLEISEQLAAADRTVGRSRKKAAEILESVAGRANDTQEALRDLARGIFPTLLADKGVIPAIESLVRKSTAPAEVAIASMPERFDPRAEAAVYFCCVDVLRRLARRDDTRPSIDLASADGWVTFAIRDGAPGAEPLDVADLQVLVDRVEAVGGTLEVVAGNGSGAALLGRVPLQVPDAQMAASLSGSNVDLLA